MHMDIIPMHISHIIMVAKTLRFMSAFLLLRFLRRCSVRDGGIITPSAANVNPLFTFLRFPQKTLQDRYAISSNFPQIKTETAYAVSVLRADKPHCACSFSFSQGELEGAKPTSNRIKCRAKPCSARRAWSEANIFVPRSGTKITGLLQAVEKSRRLFRPPEQRRLTPSLFFAKTAAGTTPPSPRTTPRRSPVRTRCPCRPRRPPTAAAHRPGTPVPAPRRWR